MSSNYKRPGVKASDRTKWDGTTTTVAANSATWDSHSDLTELASASGGWNSTETTVNANSSVWSQTSDLTELASASGGWNSTETTVNANSSVWSNHFDSTEISSASGGWNSTQTTVNSNSANWDSVYTSVTDTSGAWDQAVLDVPYLSGAIDGNSSDITYLSGQIDGSNEFIELTDTPASYSGVSSYFVRVNTAEDGVVFDDFETTVNTLTSDLQTQITNNDNDITYLSGQIVPESIVNGLTGDLQTQITNNDNDIVYLSGSIDTNITNIDYLSGQIAGSNEFIELTDTPTVYTAASGYFLTVTDNATGVEFVDFRTEVSTATGSLQTQITNNDSDITYLSGAIDNNSSDITYLSGAIDGENLWDLDGTTLTPAISTNTLTLPYLTGDNTVIITDTNGLLTDTTVSITEGPSGGSILNLQEFAIDPLSATLATGDLWVTDNIATSGKLLTFWDGTYKYSVELSKE